MTKFQYLIAGLIILRSLKVKIYLNTLPFIPSPQGRGDSQVPSPLRGEGKGEGVW